MPTITMPKLSDTMTEGTLLRWCKKKGDAVEIGDLLAEIETDKATMEMEAFDEGVLSELYVEAGGKAAVGAPIALILGANEKPGSVVPAVSSAASSGKATPAAANPTPIIRRAPLQGLSKATTISSERIKVSPLARKIAMTRGVILENLRERGTGPGGRIVAADVLEARVGGAVASGSPSAAALIMPAVITGNPETRIPLSNIRQRIAERMVASKTQIPHFYLSIELDAAPMMAFRKEFNATGNKITFNDLVLLAAARAAVEQPKVNAAFAGDSIYQYESINLCVAIAVEGEVVAPRICDAQKLSLQEISATVKDLAARARDKKLKPEEYSGGTLTVSNLGAYGIDQFFGIINPPQTVILGVGAILKKPVVNAQDQVVVGHRLTLTLSGDHRVVDGAVAAEYLAAVRKFLETPSLFLV